MRITESMIDAGAKALRERLQSGRHLRAWESLPNTVKRKWRDYAAVVLTAAEPVASIEWAPGDFR